MSAVVQAAALAPQAFGTDDAQEDTLEYDLGNLAAFDTQPVDPAAFESGREAGLLSMATAAAQSLVRNLFFLPVEPSEFGPLVRECLGGIPAGVATCWAFEWFFVVPRC